MRKIEIRIGQAPDKHDRVTFAKRFRASFMDPAFAVEEAALARIEEIAWQAYDEGRKAPRTRKAGPGYANPDYDLSVDWIDARARIDAAQAKWQLASTPSNVLVINASARNDGTCPGEISKSFRLSKLVIEELEAAGATTDLLDLSLLVSDYDRHIHPCKGCVSTAMPLCHWPCSCYPNHATRQTNDWMNEIYERWVSAHGVVIVTPVYWYQSPSPLKLMIDRLVCADGGNPDPTLTDGKDAKKAKQVELDGWDYPKHLAGRAYGVVVHGDVAGIEGSRRMLSDWLDWMGLLDAGAQARLDRFIGYYQPYATSHQALDEDKDAQQEVRNVGKAVARTVRELRAGGLKSVRSDLPAPRPK